jgi:SAM-dependent methyltransferase
LGRLLWGRQRIPVRLLFTATIFLSAALLFGVQPMFARMVLPLLGGSPSVWNTALVFYQAALLVGYAYVHLSTTRLGARAQVALHAVVLTLPLFFLPIAVPPGASPPTQELPVGWLLALLASGVGLPFLAVSTTSPLLQKWFAHSGDRAAADPYFLYAASNVGSLLSLLAYPFLIEPRLSLQAQSALWRAGYVAFALLVFACGLALLRRGEQVLAPSVGTAREPGEPEQSGAPIAWARRARWVLLALAPSSLMVGATTFMSNEIAAIPLLWIVPLSLYLLSFIVAFTARPLLPHFVAPRAFAILVLPLAVTLAVRAVEPMSLLVPLHLAVLFAACAMCHGEMARDRPGVRHLSEFYAWMSLGGVLGGAFNALVAPQIFSSVTEYPVALVLACLLMPRALAPVLTSTSSQPGTGQNSPFASERARRLDVALPVGLGAVTLALVLGVPRLNLPAGPLTLALMFGPAAMASFAFSRRPLRFGLALAALFGGGSFYWLQNEGALVFKERSFFGVHRVTQDGTGKYFQLVHGNTTHGVQSREAHRRREPLFYYHRDGPTGQVFSVLNQKRGSGARVASVGLGVGALAAYGRAGQSWTFYEIDPTVERIARDTRLFTYLSDSAARPRVVLGDARLSLRAVPNASLDLIAMDAYSSDAIPVHLLTREAIAMYKSKLAPGGLIAFHISNRHLDLESVLGNLLRQAEMPALVHLDVDVSPAQGKAGKAASHWAVAALREEDLQPLARDARWKKLRTNSSPEWTDDYSSLLAALTWR